MIRLNDNSIVFTEDRINLRRSSHNSRPYQPKPEELKLFTQGEIDAYKRKVRANRRRIEDRQIQRDLADQ